MRKFFEKGPNGRKKFVLKRNHVIIAALVVMIGVTGYLNLRDNRQAEEGLALTPSGEIMALIMDDMIVQDVAMVNTTLDEAGNLDFAHNNEIATVATDPGAAVFVNTSNDSSFFIQAKLNREQARSGQMASLTEMINNLSIAQEQRAEKATQMTELLSRIEREAATEALIEAKGFAEVYVRISDNAVDIVVDRAELTDQEVAQIVDVALRKTGMALDQIFISPLRQN
ncbi:MAG: SpoIIIAH-like family protein [Clostridiales bacterium]|jgi:stage III sporulation protein AH|nr:SpoIIIAH-like family protein [Clostridiales bacterium]